MHFGSFQTEENGESEDQQGMDNIFEQNADDDVGIQI
jgi:hypothetical protein